MTPERQKRTIISLLIVGALLTCTFFSMRQSPYHHMWELALTVVILLSVLWSAKYQSRRRQPDTTTHLFPTLSANSKERS